MSDSWSRWRSDRGLLGLQWLQTTAVRSTWVTRTEPGVQTGNSMNSMNICLLQILVPKLRFPFVSALWILRRSGGAVSTLVTSARFVTGVGHVLTGSGREWTLSSGNGIENPEPQARATWVFGVSIELVRVKQPRLTSWAPTKRWMLEAMDFRSREIGGRMRLLLQQQLHPSRDPTNHLPRVQMFGSRAPCFDNGGCVSVRWASVEEKRSFALFCNHKPSLDSSPGAGPGSPSETSSSSLRAGGVCTCHVFFSWRWERNYSSTNSLFELHEPRSL